MEVKPGVEIFTKTLFRGRKKALVNQILVKNLCCNILNLNPNGFKEVKKAETSKWTKMAYDPRLRSGFQALSKDRELNQA